MGGGVEEGGGERREDGGGGWEEGGRREGRMERRMVSFDMLVRSFLWWGSFELGFAEFLFAGEISDVMFRIFGAGAGRI